MGGYISSPSSDETNPAKELLEAYKQNLYALDGAAVGLFRAIDSMDAVAETLVKELQRNFEDTDQTSVDTRLQEYRKLAGRLLNTTQCAVLHQKDITLRSLISMIDFMKQAISENNKSIHLVFRELYLQRYKDLNELGSRTENKNIDLLTNKIENQAEEIKKLRVEVNMLKEREESFIDQENLKRKEIELLVETRKEETRNLQKQIEINETLQKNLEDSQRNAERLKNKYADLEQTNLNLSKETEEIVKFLNDSQEKYTQEKEYFETENTKYKDKMTRLKARILDLNKKVQEMEKRLLDIEKEKNDAIALHEKKAEDRIATANQEKEHQFEMLREEHNIAIKMHSSELQQTQNKLARIEDENKKYEEKMKEEHSLRVESSQKMRKKLEELSQAKLKYESEKAQLKRTISELRENLQRFQEVVKKHETELEVKQSEMNTLNLRNNKIITEEQRKKQDYECKLKSLTDKNESLQKSLTEQECNRKSMQESVDKEIRKHVNDIRKRDERIRELERLIGETLETAYKESKSFIDQQQTYEERLQEKDQVLNNNRIEIRNLSKKLDVERDNIKKCREAYASKENELSEKLKTLKKFEEIMSEMEKEQKQLSKRLESVQKELDRLRRRKIVPVQLYSQKRSDLTQNVEENLIQLLQNEFVSDRLELEFWKCSRLSDIKPKFPLLVICITVSRIGTDVANAIQGISLSPNMAVMIFHHKDEHALPNQLSERVLTGKELKGIGGIFDMAYFSEKGIYPCEMNSDNAVSLVTFIKRLARDIDL